MKNEKLSPSTIQVTNGPNWLYYFQRVTSHGEYMREIDGLRFLAISGVYLLHLNDYVLINAPQLDAEHSLMTRLLGYCCFSVQLFFAISGFILALPFARHYLAGGKPVSMKAYYLRRLTRLEPPLVVNLTILMLLMFFALHRPLMELLQHTAATGVYLHSAIYGTASSINPVTWSLEVEAQFYIAMPLLAKVFSIRSTLIRRGVIVGAMVVFSYFSREFPRTFLAAQLAHFLVGFLVADFWFGEWKGKLSPKGGFDFYAIASGTALCLILIWHRVIPFSDVLLPSMLMVFFATSINSRYLANALRHWIPVTLGGMSYTFYLYHYLLLSGLLRITGPWITVDEQWLAYALQFIVATPFVIAVSMVMFALVERPFMIWRPKWAR
jgi:peptidoglycan/LPS O-acetylase OafA/YrhL